ncbi:DUF454 family protein [Providencia sp. wls1943]|nr:DUF454 family protein [Providencia sp. wls1943]MTB65962.1 DUF454 family protein [Providencia sp. wls1943]
MNIKKIIFITVGWIAVGLAFLGAILPVMPTTCFLLLAAWCFSRSSPRFHNWLLYRSWFGGYLRHWQAHRALPKGVKPKAMTLIVITFAFSIWVVSYGWLKIGLFLGMCWLLIFMYRLPVVDVSNSDQNNEGL